MFINKNIKYRDILIFALIGVVGYKIIDNYQYFFGKITQALSILSPFIYALVCAYVLNPIVKCFERKFNFKRSIAIALTYLILVGIIFVGLFFTIPSVVDSILNITTEIPNYMVKVQDCINLGLTNERINELITQSGLLSNIQNITTQIGNMSMELLQDFAVYLISLTSNLVNIVLGFLISIYVLIEKDNIVKMAKTVTYMILKEKSGIRLLSFIRTYNKMIGMYVGIKAIDSMIIGSLALIGLVILKVPYAPLLALIVGITNMIPYFGPLVGIVISSIVTLFSSPLQAVIVALILFALQQFDAWYLEPKLIGKKVGVSPLAIIFGVTLGGGILGPVGMILGSPTMATARIYYNKLVDKFKESNKELIKKENLDK
ncbi:AI-2E family transporter [uncultured Clostridium sp.]|uniref:AI-2E family transporter n=1 Tax=uncultured Clostridium sp. TaxID=59620 RepID=UPI0025F016AC|nr:AI-2E family transporter [uncultured Clostridium sp.]